MPASSPLRHRLCRLASGGALTAFLAMLPTLAAAQISPKADREISGLLKAVGSSGCQFIRSGTAYAADRAQAHLLKKYEHMASRNMLASAEDFIVKAATRSSMSGEAYAMRCGEAPPQRCDEWLMAKLKALRQVSPS
jgi:Family of unknown function (DUF5329)